MSIHRRSFLKAIAAVGVAGAAGLRPSAAGAAYDPKAKFELKVFEVEFRRTARGRQLMARIYQPQGAGPFPGILYSHWHGAQYDLGKDEMWLDAPDGNGKRGEALAKRGFVVLAIDAYGFGERSGLGPDGPQQKGAAEEMSLSKAVGVPPRRR